MALDENDLQHIAAALQPQFEAVDARFDAMLQLVTTNFDVTLRLITDLRDDMNKRFERVDQRFETLTNDMNTRFAQIDRRFERLEKRMDSFDAKLGDLRLEFLSELSTARRTV